MQVLQHGDCLIELKKIMANSIDSVITDPPAGISFMNKSWDDDKGGRKEWITWMSTVMAECLRVLKPGGHALIWAIPRTSHWTATAVEDAGFEVRDVVTHLFGSGFPKSLDISKAIDKEAGAKREVVGFNSNHRTLKPTHSMVGEPHSGDGSLTAPSTDAAKQWQGFGTALKPAAEFWILARKPLSEKTVAKNVLKHGTGGLNIDGSRIGNEIRLNTSAGNTDREKWRMNTSETEGRTVQGRFPSNLVLSGDAPEMLDEQSGISKSTGGRTVKRGGKYTEGKVSAPGIFTNDDPGFGDIGGASRFFYCAKVSPSERGETNTHPTVKPQKLMQYLIKLITPPGGTVLDPFMGSGSTGLAAKTLGFRFIGIEKEKEYYEIAEARIESVMI